MAIKAITTKGRGLRSTVARHLRSTVAGSSAIARALRALSISGTATTTTCEAGSEFRHRLVPAVGDPLVLKITPASASGTQR